MKPVTPLLLLLVLLLAACGSLQTESDPYALESVAPATHAVIDFEQNLDPGEIASSVWQGRGVRVEGGSVDGRIGVFAATFAFRGPDSERDKNLAMIFDATCNGSQSLCSGTNPADTDLYQPDQRNVLIVSEDRDGTDPDDAVGGTITLKFEAFGPGAVTVKSLRVLDIDTHETDGTIEFYDAAGLVTTMDIPVTGDGGIVSMDIGQAGVTKMRVLFAGSGAIDDIELGFDRPGDPCEGDDCGEDECEGDDCGEDECDDDCGGDECDNECGEDECDKDCGDDECDDDCEKDECNDDCGKDECDDDCGKDECDDDCKDDECDDDCHDRPEPPAANCEGCTPGFWKNHTGLGPQANAWPQGFDPERTTFADVFGVTIIVRVDGERVRDPLLLEALHARGGGENALARHAAAAMLNAVSPEIAYAFGEAEVLRMVKRALAGDGSVERVKDALADANEAGCDF